MSHTAVLLFAFAAILAIAVLWRSGASGPVPATKPRVDGAQARSDHATTQAGGPSAMTLADFFHSHPNTMWSSAEPPTGPEHTGIIFVAADFCGFCRRQLAALHEFSRRGDTGLCRLYVVDAKTAEESLKRALQLSGGIPAFIPIVQGKLFPEHKLSGMKRVSELLQWFTRVVEMHGNEAPTAVQPPQQQPQAAATIVESA